ncbi:hypothetical protein TrRE_jg6629 [Triparma retinervis]|uniref:Lipoxygenase domain-containing protein n=1 Tax=Triparma retinervis TaxID=2557542 RepID=A0A9W6ZA71_9STRA|nr:hypothetical protein TrRE_jg6629 [Triparma retinervis]
MSRALSPNIQTFGPEGTNDGAPKRGLVGANGKNLNRMQSVYHDKDGNFNLKRFLAVVGVAAVAGAMFLAYVSGAASDQSAPQSVTTEVTQSEMQAQPAGWRPKRGFCFSCANAPSRSWSWWFGWGGCECYAGWSGTCCDIPDLHEGECTDYGDLFEMIHDHDVVPGIPFHKDQVTAPCSNAWSIDALGQGVAPVVVNMIYVDIDEYPPQHVLDSLDDVQAATKDNSYWSLVWEVMKMFANIFTDDRGVEYEMVQSLTECKGVATDYAADPTGLTALSTMGKCYEQEKDMIDEKYDGTYKPSLPEYNEFWRLIDSHESVMFAMVEDKSDEVPLNWIKDDDMFGWLRRVGSNPDMLRIATSADLGEANDFAVTDDMYNLATGETGTGTLNAALSEGRLFMLDFSIFPADGLTNKGKYLSSPKALFASPKNPSERMKTIAIQQYQKPSANHPLLGAPDPSRRNWNDATLTDDEKQTLIKWIMAKTTVQVAESSYFEVVTHFGRTHLVMEPFMMATNMAFHDTHPIRKLLQPHFEGTLHINQGAVDSLISVGGVIDKIFPPPIELTQTIAVQACKDFLENFNDNAFDKAFELRGTLTLPEEYPFRDDGFLVWNAIKAFTLEYVKVAYKTDREMRDDPWLQCFWDTLVSPTGGMLKKAGDNGNNVLWSREYLSTFLSTIIWTASGQHAATNFPQKDVGAHVTMNPTAAYSDGKTGGTVTMQDWFDLLPPLSEALDQLNTEYLLGSVHYNRLGRYEEDYIAGHFKGEYRQAELNFQADLTALEAKINERNSEAGTMRGDVYKYEILLPDNTPLSINI